MRRIINNIEIGNRLYAVTDGDDLNDLLPRVGEGWRLPTIYEFKLFKWMRAHEIGNFQDWEYWVVYENGNKSLCAFTYYATSTHRRRVLLVRDIK